MSAIDQPKPCGHCGHTLPPSAYYVETEGRFPRLSSYCRPCASKTKREAYRQRVGWTEDLTCRSCGSSYPRNGGRGRQFVLCEPCRSDPSVPIECSGCRERKPRSEFKKGRKHCYPCEAIRVKPYNRVTLLKKYGLTVGAFEDMLSAQHNQCAICYDWLETTPHVDHHHGTGRVRGLLCRRCNIGIGHFREDERILSSALAYVHFDGPHFSTVSVSFTRKS